MIDPTAASASEEATELAAALSIDDVRAAAARIAGQVRRTPALRVPALDELADAELFLKAENLQHVGAFKARGALHALSRVEPELRARGVITYSSGNHAQAVAYAARAYGVPARIAMPIDAPAVKVAGVRALGGEIIFAGTTSDDRRRAAIDLAEETGAVIIEPFDHPDTISGQGTATLELLEQVAEATEGGGLDALVVPVGGGGLIAGACLVADAEGVRVFSAEPSTCDALARSLEAGERVDVPPGPSIADGLRPVRVGALNWAIARASVQAAFTVDDDELGLAMIRLLLRAKVLVEPSGAAALAVALRRALPIDRASLGRRPRIGVLLSGGNVAPERVGELLARYGGQV